MDEWELLRTTGTRFITEPQLLNGSQFPNQLTKRFFATRNDPERSHLPVLLGYCHCNRLGMDIQTNKFYSFLSTGSLRLWLCTTCLPIRSITHVPRLGAGHSILTKQIQSA
jgi:hypothetical protein